MSRPTIAVVGASKDRQTYGTPCVRASIQGDYEVYPVNPHADEIEGQRVYRTLSEIPAGLDRISIYLPPESTTSLLAELTSWPDTEIWFNPGSADAGVLESFPIEYPCVVHGLPAARNQKEAAHGNDPDAASPR